MNPAILLNQNLPLDLVGYYQVWEGGQLIYQRRGMQTEEQLFFVRDHWDKPHRKLIFDAETDYYQGPCFGRPVHKNNVINFYAYHLASVEPDSQPFLSVIAGEITGEIEDMYLEYEQFDAFSNGVWVCTSEM